MELCKRILVIYIGFSFASVCLGQSNFSISNSRSEVCGDCSKNLPQENPLTKENGKIVCAIAQVAPKSCEQTAVSPECKSVYKEIEADGGKVENYRPSCSTEEIAFDPEASLMAGNLIFGCAEGVFDGTFVDFGKFLGESAAKIITDSQADKICNSKIENKKLLYISHNETVPEELKVQIPSDATLKAYDCSELKRSIFEENRYLTLKMQRAAGVKFKSSFEFGLLKIAKARLHQMGIELKCYNPQKQAELLCKSATYVTTAVLSVAAVSKLRLVGGLKDLPTEIKTVMPLPKIAEAPKNLDISPAPNFATKNLTYEDIKPQHPVTPTRNLSKIAKEYEDVLKDVVPDDELLDIIADAQDRGVSKSDLKDLLRISQKECSRLWK